MTQEPIPQHVLKEKIAELLLKKEELIKNKRKLIDESNKKVGEINAQLFECDGAIKILSEMIDCKKIKIKSKKERFNKINEKKK